MMDYQGVYEDILAMEHRVQAAGYDNEPSFAALHGFITECIQFRRDIILQCRSMIGYMTVPLPRAKYIGSTLNGETFRPE